MTTPSRFTPAAGALATTGRRLMIDTIRPDLIPPAWPHAVMPYRDGSYEWRLEEISRFEHVIGISVTGDPAMTSIARALDVERFDATPAAAPAWCDSRLAKGHRDATIYCSRNTLPPVLALLGVRRPRLIIATLDNHDWNPAELAADIAVLEHVDLDPRLIWGIQKWPADAAIGIYWDTTEVYGDPDFWDPPR